MAGCSVSSQSDYHACMLDMKDELEAAMRSYFAMDEEEITMDSSFVDDLNADSVDLVELVMAMEEEFDVGEIEEDELTGLKTVKDCVRFLSSKLGD